MPAIGQVPIAPAVAAPIPVGAISVSSLTALTLSQQETIERGTIVVTPTQTYVYIGAGSKTSSASYIDLIGANLVLTNDSRISGIAGGSITTSKADQIALGVLGGSITSGNYGGNISTTGYGGSINLDGYGGNLDLSNHGGSITTGPYGGAINTTGQGSIELGSTAQGNPAGTEYGRTILKGSASGNSPQTITFPNATGTIALTNDVRFGSQTIFTLGGEAKTTFALGASYLYGCMPTRGPMMFGSYTSAVLRILGNFTVTGITIHQYLPSGTTATLTYQLMRITIAGATPLGPSIVVGGNNNLTTSASSISASLNSGDEIGLMLTLGASGTVPVATAATTILANIYCVPR